MSFQGGIGERGVSLLKTQKFRIGKAHKVLQAFVGKLAVPCPYITSGSVSMLGRLSGAKKCISVLESSYPVIGKRQASSSRQAGGATERTVSREVLNQ